MDELQRVSMSVLKVSTTHGGVDGSVVTSASLIPHFSLLISSSVHLIASSHPPPSLPPSLLPPSSLPPAPFLPPSCPLPPSFLPPPSGCRQEEGGGHVWPVIHPCGFATVNCSEFDRGFDDYGTITRQCTKEGGRNCNVL